MATVEKKLLTAEEFYDLPDPGDGSKQELVRGEVISMAAPGFEHGEVQGNVHFAIKLFLKSNKLGRVVVESGVVTERGPDSVRGPDVSYYSAARLPLDKRVVKYADLPPDLCVEVVSPSNTKRYLGEKLREYFFVGVREVWIVDPNSRSVAVHSDPGTCKTLGENDTLDGGSVLPGFSCPVADLFG